jgi:hypothetical protein
MLGLMRLHHPFASLVVPLALAAACGSSPPASTSTSGTTGHGGSSSSSGVGPAGSGSGSDGSGGHGGAGTADSTSSGGAGPSGSGGAALTTTAATAAASTSGGCVPQCAGKQCGTDGCGGDCGPCAAGLACTSGGACVGSPPGPAVKRFDVATSLCTASYAGCTLGATSYAHCCPTTVPGDPVNKCFCDAELAHLNAAPAHFLAVGTDGHRGDLWAAGNFQAVYVDTLNDMYPGSTGAAKADAVIAAATTTFPTGVPEWFIVNEISTSQWPSDAAYRTYVRAFAARLAQNYSKSVVVASPFPAPAANAADWTALAGNAYVAVEIQLTGKDVNGNGNSVAWCKTQLEASVTAYGNQGVGLGRLMLVDNYANSAATTGFGRQGVSAAGWKNAIDAREQAAKQVGFAGYISYAWANNEMADTAPTRTGFEDDYLGNPVP